jgi:hypothetical protein
MPDCGAPAQTETTTQARDKLVISYGLTGYVALYRFVVSQDEVRILALRHQREIGFLP